MKKIKVGLLGMVVSVLLLSPMAFATSYTNETDFLANIQPGFYLENFDSNSYSGTNPINFSGGAFIYNATAPDNGLWGVSGSVISPAVPGALSTANNLDSLIITFTGADAPVTAVGGQFFLTDAEGNDINGNVTITLPDDSFYTLTISAVGDNYVRPFFGYTTNTPLLWLQISSVADIDISGNRFFPTIDHFYVGQVAVPEPTTIMLLGLGLVGLAGIRRRKN